MAAVFTQNANSAEIYATDSALQAATGMVPGSLAYSVQSGLYYFDNNATSAGSGELAADDNTGVWKPSDTPNIYVNDSNVIGALNIGDASLDLANGKIFIGNASGVAAQQTVSGDFTISNAGVGAISAGAIVNADINASAAIALSKLAAGAANQTIVTNGSGVPEYETVSHLIVGAGSVAYAGGGTSTTGTISVMQDTDVVSVWLIASTNVVALKGSHSGTTLTITFSADPGANTVIGYSVMRAVA
jgi:hypothetical protein